MNPDLLEPTGSRFRVDRFVYAVLAPIALMATAAGLFSGGASAIADMLFLIAAPLFFVGLTIARARDAAMRWWWAVLAILLPFLAILSFAHRVLECIGLFYGGGPPFGSVDLYREGCVAMYDWRTLLLGLFSLIAIARLATQPTRDENGHR